MDSPKRSKPKKSHSNESQARRTDIDASRIDAAVLRFEQRLLAAASWRKRVLPLSSPLAHVGVAILAIVFS